MEKRKKKVTHSEWLFLLSIVGLLVWLSLNSYLTQDSSQKVVEKAILQDKMVVYIDGAIDKPGRYEIQRGTTLKELLDKALVKKESDLSHLQLKDEVQSNTIYIPYQRKIMVHIRGWVKQPLDLLVYRKSKICDLIDKIELLPNADNKILSKKRYLKDGETIFISHKI